MSSRDQLRSYLTQLEKRLRLALLLRGAALVASAALAATLILVLVANAFAFSPGSLTGARAVLFFTLVVALSLGVVLPLYVLNRDRAAGRAEAVFPQFQQRLVTFVDRDAHQREPFIELLAADTLELASQAQPERLVSKHKLLLSLATSVACMGALTWLIVAGPGYLGYGARQLWAGSSRRAAYYDIRVSPGDAAVRRNGSQTITAQLVGFESAEARLQARYQSASSWEEVTMQPRLGASGFQFVLAGIPEDVEYYVQADRVSSRHYRIRVVDLPAIKQIRVTYHYPAWTGLKTAVEDRGGDLHAVEGTDADLAISTDRPIHGGVLVLNDGQKMSLSGNAGNAYHGTIRIKNDGSYHVAAIDRGQLLRLSDDFVIEASKVNPPEVSITRPGGDYHASPIEEVTVAVKASDDYGLTSVQLDYSINGGPARAINMLRRKGAKQADGSTLLSLENFRVVPGDVVSIDAAAKDTKSVSRTAMYFIEVDPFEREYSQSQLAGGGLGQEQFELSQRQKEIIAATWNQQGNQRASQQEASGTGKFLSGVQGKLRTQALWLAGLVQQRELSDENEEFSAFQRDMSAAAEAMGPAAKKLSDRRWSKAIPSEERALQGLLRAEATFRRIQVAFGGQGGGGAGAGRDLANLVDLELNTEKNQYETGQTAESERQRAQQTDKALQKLDELARRQQELARQQPGNGIASFQQRWQQDMLRREAEQLQNRLEQLAQGSRQGQQGSAASGSQGSNGQSASGTGEPIQRTIDQLRQAVEAMRRATPQGEGAANARRAASQLKEARKLLSSVERQQISPQLDSLAREADRLAGEERSQAARIRQMFGNQNQPGLFGQPGADAGDMEQSKLADERQLLADDLSRLEKAMQDSARGLAPSQPGAAAKLHQTLGEMDQGELRSRLERSGQAIRLGIDPGSKTIEPAITAGIDRLGEGIREAQRALKGPQQNPDEEALDRVARLRSEIESLTRSLNNSHSTSGRPAAQSQTGQEAQGGRRGGVQASSGQGSQNAESNGGFQSGGPGGPRVWQPGRTPGIGTYIEPQGGDRGASSDTDASRQLAVQGAQRELDALRRELRSEPESLADVQQLMRDLQRLGPGSFPGNPALVQQLSAQALSSAEKLELQLRRKLDDQQTGQARNGDSLQIPQGYQNSVAQYFRQLSKAH
jgi:hypothetical protein